MSLPIIYFQFLRALYINEMVLMNIDYLPLTTQDKLKVKYNTFLSSTILVTNPKYTRIRVYHIVQRTYINQF